jgi:polysaccharide export outer membrane protein
MAGHRKPVSLSRNPESMSRVSFFGLMLAMAATGALAQAPTDVATVRVTEPSADLGRNAPDPGQEYLLGTGDMIKIQVFQNPDLTLETRVSESGTITYPLIGTVRLGGIAISKAEMLIARMLDEGGFVIKPQVSLLVLQVRGNEVSALGQFNHPGRFPLETTQTHLSDVIAQAGGIAPNGADEVILVGVRDGKPFRQEIDVTAMYTSKRVAEDLLVRPGDVVYVQRAPQVYIYGEVQRPGMFRLERDMTVMQALAEGGGLTPRGTQHGVRVHRRGADGRIQVLKPELDERLQPDDVVYVRESLF